MIIIQNSFKDYYTQNSVHQQIEHGPINLFNCFLIQFHVPLFLHSEQQLQMVSRGSRNGVTFFPLAGHSDDHSQAKTHQQTTLSYKPLQN